MTDGVDEQNGEDQNTPEQRGKFRGLIGLYPIFAIIVAIIGIRLIAAGVPGGTLVLAMAILYFLSKWRSRVPNTSRAWGILGTAIGSLFVFVGLAAVGVFVLFMIALASWGSGGGSGK
ncbi:MAG TPA: hypothetical protein VMT23_01115 [Candidatus Binatia bacterium]|nr:hypothetical protein [Candidatus Binatia bacterium]